MLYKLYSSGGAWLEARTLYNALQHVRREGRCEEVREGMVPQHHPAYSGHTHTRTTLITVNPQSYAVCTVGIRSAGLSRARTSTQLRLCLSNLSPVPSVRRCVRSFVLGNVTSWFPLLWHSSGTIRWHHGAACCPLPVSAQTRRKLIGIGSTA